MLLLSVFDPAIPTVAISAKAGTKWDGIAATEIASRSAPGSRFGGNDIVGVEGIV